MILRDGGELYFPECEYWKDNGGTLDLKEDRHGNKIARLNWDTIVAVHKSDKVERRRRNSN